MKNKPKYNIFSNTSYALVGLSEIIKNEISFKIEIIIFLILFPWIFLFDFSMVERILLFVGLSGVLLAEVINSAIERTVDLVTLEYNEMAKKAKDASSAIVFISVIIFIFIWGTIFYDKVY